MNRTIREIRDTLKKHNGRLAPVSYLFEKIGRAQVKVPVGTDRDGNIEAMLVAAEAAGGEDFEIIEDSDIVEVCFFYHTLLDMHCRLLTSSLVLLPNRRLRCDDKGY